MRHAWPTKRLKEIATVAMGQSPPGETYNTSGMGLPFFQGKAEFTDSSPIALKWCSAPTRIAETGDILLSVRAPVGPTNVADRRCCIGRGLAAIQAKEGLASTRYLRYYFRWFEDRLARQGVGSTFTAINRQDIEQLSVPLPPLPEQERIVKLLDAAEELRRLRAAADRRTADLIPSLFYNMFGDPATNPKGWPTPTLGILIVDGPQNGLYKHSSFYGAGTPILRIDGFYDGFIDDLTSLKRLQITSEEVEKYRLRPNDIIINRVNSPDYLGKSAIVPRVNEPTVFESNMMRFSVDREQIDPFFLIFHLQTPAIKQQIAKNAKHAIHQSSINQEDVKSLVVLRPPLSLQRQFAARVAEIRALETQQAASRRRLDDLFQSMLHRAFRGEL